MTTEKNDFQHTRPAAADYSTTGQWLVCKLNSSEQAVLATTQGEKVLGILQNNPASGANATLRVFGQSKATYGGTVALFDPLCVDTASKLIKANDEDEYVLAIALEAGSANERHKVLLVHAGSISSSVGQETYVSSANYSSSGQYCLVKEHTTAGQIVKCASAGERAFGILQNAPAALAEAEVCTGGQCTGKAGTGGLSAGQAFAAAADGTLIAATGSAIVLGWAEAAIAEGATGTVFFAASGINSVDGAALASAKMWVGTAGGLAAAVTMSGDVTNDNAGVQTIGAKKVTAAKMYSAAQGVIFRGEAANAVGELSLADGKIAVGDGTDVAALSVKTAGSIPYGNGTTLTTLALASGKGKRLRSNAAGTAPVWDKNKLVKAVFAGMTANTDPFNFKADNITAVSGTTGHQNMCCLPDGTKLGYFILGAGQTITGPVGAVDAIDIGCDQVDNEGIELFSNCYGAEGMPFCVGFDAAFYALIKLQIQLANGSDDWFFGFRKAETVNADAEAYDTFFGLGVNTVAAPAALKVRDELNGGGATNTDTTQTIASATDLQIKVLVSAAGVCTVQHDAAVPGTLAAPTATHALTLDAGDMVFPYFRFLHANAAQAGTVLIKDWEVGYQA